MKFPKKSLKILKDYIFSFFKKDKKPSGNLFYLLARYLTHSNQFAAVAKNVKTSVFMPHHMALSVFGIEYLSEQQIWNLGAENLSLNENRPIKGRAEILADTVTTIGLLLSKDNNPPRHANIIGWPEMKSEQKLYAGKLALRANLVLNPLLYP